MPIRPIDIVKTPEAAQYKQIQNQRPQHEQVQISKNFQNMIQSEANKTQQTAKSDYKEFRYDAKEEGKNSYKGNGGRDKREKDEHNKENSSNNNKGRPGGIDILI